MDPDSAQSPLTIESRKSKSPHSGDDVEQRPIKKQKGGNKDQKPGVSASCSASRSCISVETYLFSLKCHYGKKGGPLKKKI